jgi:capsular polysaccharide transport system permease protein
VQRLKYLVIVTTPSLADASLFPDRTYNIGTAAMLLLILYFVVSLIVAIIREHA